VTIQDEQLSVQCHST